MHDLPNIFITGESSVCQNTLATLTAQGEDVMFNWSNGATEKTIQPFIYENTSFSVEGTDIYGCKSKTSYNIESKDPPVLSYIGDTIVCEGQSLTLVAQGASSFVWHDGTIGGVYNKIPTSDTIYSFTGTLRGCTSVMLE